MGRSRKRARRNEPPQIVQPEPWEPVAEAWSLLENGGAAFVFKYQSRREFGIVSILRSGDTLFQTRLSRQAAMTAGRAALKDDTA